MDLILDKRIEGQIDQIGRCLLRGGATSSSTSSSSSSSSSSISRHTAKKHEALSRWADALHALTEITNGPSSGTVPTHPPTHPPTHLT